MLMRIPCSSWHNLSTWMDCCEVSFLTSAGWGYNVYWQRRTAVTAAAMRHSNPISPISHKWSSQQEVFPNYLTTISLTTRHIPLRVPKSRRWSRHPSKCRQGFIDIWFIWWLMSYNDNISLILVHWRCFRDAEEDTEDGLHLSNSHKAHKTMAGGKSVILSVVWVKEQSGFICAIRGHLVSAWPSGRWDYLPEFSINHWQKSLLLAIYARAPSPEQAAMHFSVGLWGNKG